MSMLFIHAMGTEYVNAVNSTSILPSSDADALSSIYQKSSTWYPKGWCR